VPWVFFFPSSKEAKLGMTLLQQQFISDKVLVVFKYVSSPLHCCELFAASLLSAK